MYPTGVSAVGPSGSLHVPHWSLSHATIRKSPCTPLESQPRDHQEVSMYPLESQPWDYQEVSMYSLESQPRDHQEVPMYPTQERPQPDLICSRPSSPPVKSRGPRTCRSCFCCTCHFHSSPGTQRLLDKHSGREGGGGGGRGEALFQRHVSNPKTDIGTNSIRDFFPSKLLFCRCFFSLLFFFFLQRPIVLI